MLLLLLSELCMLAPALRTTSWSFIIVISFGMANEYAFVYFMQEEELCLVSMWFRAKETIDDDSGA